MLGDEERNLLLPSFVSWEVLLSLFSSPGFKIPPPLAAPRWDGALIPTKCKYIYIKSILAAEGIIPPKLRRSLQGIYVLSPLKPLVGAILPWIWFGRSHEDLGGMGFV